MKILGAVVILGLIGLASALHAGVQHEQDTFPVGEVVFQADTGKFMSRCNRCGPGHQPDSPAIFQEDTTDPTTKWTAEKVGDKYAFKADTGKYLAVCKNCWYRALYSNSVFINEKSSSKSAAQWTP